MVEENNTGTNLIWALTTIIIVAIIAGAIYFSGIFSGAGPVQDKDIDVEIKAPATK